MVRRLGESKPAKIIVMKAVILAGGLGTRLRERIVDLPKPMIPISGRPFLEYVLDRLVKGGVREVTLSVGYRAESIQSHFGTNYRGATLRYTVEAEPLGTGGAIVLALRGHNDDPVLVLNGDTLLALDYSALVHWYEQNPTPVAIVLKKVPDVSRFGSVTMVNGRVTGFIEKGQTGSGLINAGVYIVCPKVFSKFKISEKFSFEMDFMQRYCSMLQPRAYITSAYFIDIGIPEDFDRAQRELGTTVL
jgi:D-glycero-alpha-D-manno-heptose 1-phosphate guanylyltransferase